MTVYSSYLSYLQHCKNFDEHHKIYLTQEDFNQNPVCLLSGVKGTGPLRLIHSGTYIIKEDI